MKLKKCDLCGKLHLDDDAITECQSETCEGKTFTKVVATVDDNKDAQMNDSKLNDVLALIDNINKRLDDPKYEPIEDKTLDPSEQQTILLNTALAELKAIKEKQQLDAENQKLEQDKQKGLIKLKDIFESTGVHLSYMDALVDQVKDEETAIATFNKFYEAHKQVMNDLAKGDNTPNGSTIQDSELDEIEQLRQLYLQDKEIKDNPLSSL